MESGKVRAIAKVHQMEAEISPFPKVMTETTVVPLRKTTSITTRIPGFKDIYLAGKEDFAESMKRICAWYECQIIDRPPVRFATHNAQYNSSGSESHTAEDWKRLKFNPEIVVDSFISSLENRKFLGETFPIYWPDIGPDAYAAFYGCELTYTDVTSWSKPIIKAWEDLHKLKLDKNNEYFRKVEELTDYALERCDGKFLVGYTDLHPGMDCALAWRGMEQLCFDLIDSPKQVKKMVEIASKDFCMIFDHFDRKLKLHDQPSVSWMEIPSFETFHIPSCDFATMMSPSQFNEFAMGAIQKEVKHAKHNIFHLDGKGVAKNLDVLLELPEITAIQWVQGVGDDLPIMQWIPLIKRIQEAGKGVIVDLQKHELEGFMEQIRPEGIFLWISENNQSEQEKILKRLEKW